MSIVTQKLARFSIFLDFDFLTDFYYCVLDPDRGQNFSMRDVCMLKKVSAGLYSVKVHTR